MTTFCILVPPSIEFHYLPKEKWNNKFYVIVNSIIKIKYYAGTIQRNGVFMATSIAVAHVLTNNICFKQQD